MWTSKINFQTAMGILVITFPVRVPATVPEKAVVQELPAEVDATPEGKTNQAHPKEPRTREVHLDVRVYTCSRHVCVHASGTSVCARRHVSPPFPNFPDLSASSLRNTCWRVTTDWPISLDLGLPSFKKRVDQRSQTFRARAVSYARIHTGCNAGVGREC